MSQRSNVSGRSSRNSDVPSEVLAAASGGHSEQTLKRLQIDRSKELGRGGYGIVYRAFDPKSRRQYAVKEVLFDEQNIAMVETLRAEFVMLGKIHHPHIIRVYNFVVEEHGIARIVMELAPNGSVRTVCKQMGGGVLSERGAKRVIYQALLGLQYLHTHGILHRDVKPDNMLMDREGIVKLSDFGTCRITMHVASGTATRVVGTVCYMSPESITGTFSMGSDLWALAASFVELVTGKPPWHETGIQQHIQQLFHIGSARPPRHHPQFPATLSRDAIEFLTACFQFDVRMRPSATQLLMLPFFLSAAAELAAAGSRLMSAQPELSQRSLNAISSLSALRSPSKNSNPASAAAVGSPQQPQQQQPPINSMGSAAQPFNFSNSLNSNRTPTSHSLRSPSGNNNPIRSIAEFPPIGSAPSQRPGTFISSQQNTTNNSSQLNTMRLSRVSNNTRSEEAATPSRRVPVPVQPEEQVLERTNSSGSFVSWHSVDSPRPVAARSAPVAVVPPLRSPKVDAAAMAKGLASPVRRNSGT